MYNPALADDLLKKIQEKDPKIQIASDSGMLESSSLMELILLDLTTIKPFQILGKFYNKSAAPQIINEAIIRTFFAKFNSLINERASTLRSFQPQLTQQFKDIISEYEQQQSPDFMTINQRRLLNLIFCTLKLTEDTSSLNSSILNISTFTPTIFDFDMLLELINELNKHLNEASSENEFFLTFINSMRKKINSVVLKCYDQTTDSATAQTLHAVAEALGKKMAQYAIETKKIDRIPHPFFESMKLSKNRWIGQIRQKLQETIKVKDDSCIIS